MGWRLLTVAATTPLPAAPSSSTSESTTVALIATLGTVIVALVTVGLPLLLKRGRTSESPPAADPQLTAKVAVLADRDETDRRTLAALDLHVDGIGDRQDRLIWQVEQLAEQVGRDHDLLQQILRDLGMR